MKKDNSNELFAASLALEAQTLEDIFIQEKHNLYNSASLLGKTWYAVGLESVDSDNDKDNANKQGIVRRMIDALVGFIKKIIEKIKAFFGSKSSDKEQAKEDEKVFREYEGPGDDTLAEALHAYARQTAETVADMQRKTAQMQKDNEEADAARKQRQAEFDKRMKESQESLRKLREGIRKETAQAHEVNDMLDKALSGVVETTAKPIAADEMTEIVEEHVSDKFIKALPSYELHFFLAMLESEFQKHYTKLIGNAQKLIQHRAEISHIEQNVGMAEELIESYNACMEIVDSKKRFGEEEWRKIFGEFLMRKGFTEVSFIYFFPTVEIFDNVLNYNETISQMLVKMRKDVTDETKDQVEMVRKSALAIMHVCNLGGRVKKVTTDVSGVLEKIGS